MSVLTTGAFWAATAERCVRTMAWVAMSTIGVNVVAVQDVNWALVGGTTALAGILDVLASISASGKGAPGPSFGPEKLKGENADN